MGKYEEIERKFLVTSDMFQELITKSHRIVQGYLSSVPERTVRVRIKGNKGFITVKGQSREGGMARFEWEKEIAVAEAEQLLRLCEPGVIDKTRHEIPLGKHTIEVDVFQGENEGLVIAEIELEKAEEQLSLPSWIGKEVTGDERYYNSFMSKHPFRSW